MRPVTSLPSLGRNFTLRSAILPLALCRSASRLSGIHDGLRRSKRESPQGARPTPGPKEIRRSPLDEPYLTPEERRAQRAIARRDRKDFKIRKGKKDITEQPGPPRQSKSARFNDPRDPFGGDSLVKQFKTGKLKETLAALREKAAATNGHIGHDDFARQMAGGDNMADPKTPKSGTRGQFQSRPSASYSPKKGAELDNASSGRGRADMSMPPREFRGRFDRPAPREIRDGFDQDMHGRDSHSDEHATDLFGNAVHDQSSKRSDFSRSDRRGRDSERTNDLASPVEKPRGDFSWSDRRGRDNEQYRESGENKQMGGGWNSRAARPRFNESRDEYDDEDGEMRPKKRYEGPISIPYTTTASQFLYGTSTVEAALQTSRRKMYKLYIYRGANRRNKEKDEALAALARRQGVAVEMVGEESLGLLGKMSDSRPHNGYVLEASPLPQLPIKALGKVSEEESWPGFKVSLGYQSREEAQINGTDDFVVTEPSAFKPFVLLLDQIVDPGNLGAILRTASFLGVTAVVMSKRGSAPVTPVVLKASAGAAETMAMFTVESPVDFVTESQQNGWKVFTAVPPKLERGPRQVSTRELERDDPLTQDPCVLVMGSEGYGLSRQLRRAADFEVSIPNLSGSRVVDSLNVSVATALLASAFLKGKAKAASSGIKDAAVLF